MAQTKAIDTFIKAANYTEKSRNGFGINVNAYKGMACVSAGKSWQKIEEDESLTPLFTKNVVVLTPEAAEQAGKMLIEAAKKARDLKIEPVEKKARRVVAPSATKQSQFITKEDFEKSMSEIKNLFAKMTAPTTEATASNDKKLVFEEEENRKMYYEKIHNDKERLVLFNELIDSDIEADEATRLVTGATI